MNPDAGSMDRSTPLIYTKISVPRARNLLPRPRLLSFLHENVHRKLLLVCGAPGYGKTSLLIDFANKTDLPVCWYTLYPADRDPRLFLEYLVEAIRVRFPSFGQRTRALLQEDGSQDYRRVVGSLVNEVVEEVPEYLVIVFDEYQAVETEEAINQILDTLLQYMPENLHLIVAGRSVPPLPIIRLAAQGAVAGIGTEALRLTEEEICTFLEHHCDLRLSDQELEQVIAKSEGWITGILLGAQSIWHGASDFLTQARSSDSSVYAYLTNEVIHHLPPETRSFLRKASILAQMEATLCDTLLGREDSARFLDLLEQRNLFLVPLEGGWYRFHGLFREFLLREAQAEQEEFIQLNRHAAQLWRERGETMEVVEHLLQARSYTEAAEEVDALTQDLYKKGQLQTLIRWVESLPQQSRQDRPRLIRFLAKAYSERGEIERGQDLFREAEQLFAQGDDLQEWIQTRADRSTYERIRGGYNEALLLAMDVLPQAEESGALATVDLHRTIGICRCALGDLTAAETHFRAAIEHSLTAAFPYNQALAYQDLGVCLRAQGHIDEADAAYQQALGLWRALDNPGPVANILNNLAMGPFLRGDLLQAHALLQEALDAAHASLSPRLQALVLASLGDLHRDTGQFALAHQSYQEGLEQAYQGHSVDLIAYLLDALGNLCRLQGAFSEARQHLQDALKTAASSPSAKARVRISLSLLENAEGRTQHALELLAEAGQTLESAGERPQLLRAWLARSMAQHRLGQVDEAHRSLCRAGQLAEEMGIQEPFLAEKETLLPLLREMSPEIRGSTLTGILHWLETQPPLHREATVREEVEPLLQVLAFGPGQVFRGEEETTTRDWGSRRARELFFYLLLRTPVSKEMIGLALWPDADRARMTSVFHATLYRARRAIGEPFVLFENETYRWNPEVPCRCDVAEFERLLDEAEDMPPNDPQSAVLLEQAVSLYRGKLLEEFDSEWCSLYRNELHERCIQALLALGEIHLRRQNYGQAQEVYQRSLQMDSFREESYRGLMRCYALAGEQAYAIQVYRQCRRHLARELRIEPSAETQSLYRAIAQGQLPSLE